ncbi:hypothetical protein EJD97_003187 [Solanum chilense]|uniref:Uncharacterized protein n=1 Tax=Solanum chilense TaxID=4083 RepID=A0A6N2AKN6_SOLCI|nr:hypothetical protein EJD97_003187 [Solanum chilense]
MLPSDQTQESEVWSPISSPPHDLHNVESVISESAKDEIDQKAIEKGKSPMPESYELKTISNPNFSNLIQGGTSEIELKKEYDYCQDLAILKSIYHYYFNHGMIPYPNYSENFINYIEASIPNLKFRGLALKAKIVLLERRFLAVVRIAGYNPNINNPVHREIFNLSMGLWG